MTLSFLGESQLTRVGHSLQCFQGQLSAPRHYRDGVPLFLFFSPFIPAVVDGHCSTPKTINSGVPQGSVLSPTLSLIHS